jgi:micrococcal nuclease
MKKLVMLGMGIVVLSVAITLFSFDRHVVTRIVDGDTVEVSGFDKNVRLIGIDTAEEGECYRDESTQATLELLLNKSVKVETDTNERDNFGRILAYVYLPDGNLINKRLLELGAGEFFYDSVNLIHQDELILAAETARKNQVGYWKTCGPCVVKGNYDIHGKRYYHLPEFRHYSQVVVNLDKADRWFCSEVAAIRAGFTRARE